ncbi:formate dehydrogenase [Rhodoferax sp.]|uniref:formate dehydrogenase n=1 Tax=Rhodoferax sp. TaxID=50421 RepID=UPI00261C588B|nr:formate dehydrogenase [Rhodoferax sp.]MDD2660981.1 hypothetical protein [Methylococcales bacterium]MDD5479782.1 formate dehydrogenase [Rhodoferax sp.]
MPSTPSRLSRRSIFLGAGTASALAAAVSVMPVMKSEADAHTTTPAAKPEKGGGYALSEHVQHYYKTARV